MIAAHFANRSAKAAYFAVTCDISRHVAHTFGLPVTFLADNLTKTERTAIQAIVIQAIVIQAIVIRKMDRCAYDVGIRSIKWSKNGAAQQAGHAIDGPAMLFGRHAHRFGQPDEHSAHELDHGRFGDRRNLARGNADVDDVDEELLTCLGVTSKLLGNGGMSAGIGPDRTNEAGQRRIFNTHLM
jgi:hypothetical protein